MRKCDICKYPHYCFFIYGFSPSTEFLKSPVFVCSTCQDTAPCGLKGKWKNGMLKCPHGVKYRHEVEIVNGEIVFKAIEQKSTILFKLKLLLGYKHIS